jgi:copper transport protein
MRRALLTGFVVALTCPAGAFAHATLKSEEPAFRERFETAPARILLHFDQGVDALPNSIVVYSANGKIVSGTARTGTDPRDLIAPLHKLKRGAYTIRWHAVSSDSHVVSGVYTFGVRMDAPPPTEAYGAASGPTRSEDIVRWLYFAALALLVGGLGFRLLVLPRSIPKRLERRFYIVIGLGLFGVVHVGVAAFIMRAEDALQLPFGRLLYGDLSPVATGTRFGQAFIAMTLGFTWVAALLFMAWLTGKRAFLLAAFGFSLFFESGLSLSGHSAVDSSWFTELADWAHLSAAVLWAGGLVQLAACVWPAAPELRRESFLRFARLAPILIAVLVAAGVYLSILRLPHLSDLWSSSYGQVLLVKLGLVTAALAWGGFHHFVVRPRLERTRWAGRSLVGEGAIAMTILLLAAILVNAKPPPQPATRTSLVSNVSSSPSYPP